MNGKFLTPEESAAYLRMHADSVRRLLRRGKLQGVKIGGGWRIPKAALNTMLSGSLPPPPPKRRDQPLTPEERRRLTAKAENDPSWKNKTTGAKRMSGPGGK